LRLCHLDAVLLKDSGSLGACQPFIGHLQGTSTHIGACQSQIAFLNGTYTLQFGGRTRKLAGD
jgi:hypothetical protein